MNRSEDEILNDELIGEAVLSLLKSGGPITTQSLLKALIAMERAEKDAVRQAALGGIIAEIGGIAAAHAGPADKESRAESRKNAFPQFNVNVSHASGKKMH